MPAQKRSKRRKPSRIRRAGRSLRSFLRGPARRGAKRLYRGGRRFWKGLDRRQRFLALGLLVVGTFLVVQALTPDPGMPSPDVCEIFELRPYWFRWTRAAEKRWGLPVALQMAIIRRESGFRSDARPPRRTVFRFFPGPRLSSAYGYSQALDATWDDYRRQADRPWARRDSFRDAVDFLGWYADVLGKVAGVGPGDPYQFYLAYHEGPTGYRRGTYRHRPVARTAASKVAKTTARFEARLGECGAALERRDLLLRIVEVGSLGASVVFFVLWLGQRLRGDPPRRRRRPRARRTTSRGRGGR